MQELVIATQNPGKIAEIRALLAGVPVAVLGLDEAGGPFDEPPEHGATFEENAAMKARVYAEMTGRMCLADDSGLEVDALGGRPRVDSAWYAYPSEAEAKAQPRDVRDPANIKRLLRELDGVPEEGRSARFVCCMVLAAGGTGFGPVDRGVGFQPTQIPAADGLPSPRSKAPSNANPRAGSGQYDGDFKTHRGNLPHWQVRDATYFVTWRLEQGTLSPSERQIVLDACSYWHGTRVQLHAATVMPDHVHMLFRVLQQVDGSWPELPDLIHSIKRFSSREIQAARGATGVLWQRESFDRIVRNSDELAETQAYIELNAVRAGLCQSAGEYPFVWRNACRLETDTTGEGTAQVLATTRGTLEGRIGLPPRVPSGEHGFGYDPVFLVAPGYERTSAELSPAEKNAISHRAMALRAMIDHIKAAV